MSADIKISEGRSFLPTETITVETKTPQPLPSIVPPAVPIQSISVVWRRREGARINLVGEIGRDKPISLAAVKNFVLRQPEESPKTILINSTGGSVDEAFKVYDFLRALPIPLSTIADKRCLSAGIIIFLAGDLRLANPRAELLLHPTHMSTGGLPPCVNAQALQRYADDLKSDDDRVLDLLEARTGFDRSDFAAEMSDEQPMSEAFAIRSGIVHEWCGLDRPVDPLWPEAARQIRAAGMILPPRLLSPSYLNACREAAHFPVID